MKISQVTSKEQWEKVYQLRKDVFVTEQGVAIEDEFDQHDNDPTTIHIVLEIEGAPAATGRLRVVNEQGKLERICVHSNFRKHGLGKEIVLALEEIVRNKGMHTVYLHGQTQAEKFYQKLGYETKSESFLEDGIPHYVMKKDLGRGV
ncbi:putative N-acetyltransferase YjcF [Paraliobacillus sp. PM-2]|uniref:GNAT family N-acetyltransferase n=1 Tax=Paraliobacillus sp. PM-2 TaxID=1462524 RepID=UPI00061C183E|nr:GNAT family N-acetyltransferase [Paraliobacillus sp. PM-2]CQR48420.1 putative N-acetyltransferase YjcF [Paraliobacillus sp. PM-2]